MALVKPLKPLALTSGHVELKPPLRTAPGTYWRFEECWLRMASTYHVPGTALSFSRTGPGLIPTVNTTPPLVIWRATEAQSSWVTCAQSHSYWTELGSGSPAHNHTSMWPDYTPLPNLPSRDRLVEAWRRCWK